MRNQAMAALMAASLLGGLCAQSDWSDVAQQAKNSIVKIIAHNLQGKATGTGFAISADGKIATNYHVVDGASKIFVKLPNCKTVGIERIVAFDKRVDLAILQVQGASLRPLSLGDSSAVKIGQEVCVIGSPLGLEQSFTTGVVSAKRLMEGFEWIQITAPISPGSSGSPVMTRSGTVIGVATFTTKLGQNLNFASSVKYLKRLLQGDQIKPEPSAPQASEELSTQQEPPSSLLVTNAEELVRAINEIKDGGEITLQPGEYRFREPLIIQKSLTIVGAGYKETVLIFEGSCVFALGEGKCGGMKFSGDGMFSIRDVSLRYSGAETGCAVLEVTRGDLRLTRCFISGGIGRDEQKSTSGCGVWVHGTSQAVISGCIIADNEVGIGIGRQAKARIELSKIFSNEVGVVILQSASCEVRHCEISSNQTGIAAIGESRLVARNNTCEGNEGSGILLQGSAQGELVGNTCRNNKHFGIVALEQSRLVARNNTCEGNEGAGIGLSGSVQGELEGNTCRNNKFSGIQALEQSRLVARNNTCEGNEGAGIGLSGSAQGELDGNRCTNNFYGVYVHSKKVKTSLKNNICYGNILRDIHGARQ
jgi:parallel beta-helix repeat protein